MKQKVRINFSDFWHPDTLAAKFANPLYQLLSTRFDLEISEQPDFLLYSWFGWDFIGHDCTRIYFTGEPSRPNYLFCDWSFSFDFSGHPRHLRWPLYVLNDMSALFAKRDVAALFAAKTDFCGFVFSNPHARERLKFLDKLSRYRRVDCGGRIRNNIGYQVADKIAFLQAYKFSIAFENTYHPGYTSEKLADALLGNTVPIYWGNPLIGRDFNTAAFVNCHDFRNQDEVVEFIAELDRDDERYRQYLGAPAFVGNVPNEYMNENRALERFELIFNTPLRPPVAQTVLGRAASRLLAPRRLLRKWRMPK